VGVYDSLKELVKATGEDNKLVIFYEKIRTNGKGTIRIDKCLTDDLYELGEDLLIVQIKYNPRKAELFSLTRGTVGPLLAALGTVSSGNNLKLRASRQSSR
jgi:hypothetical protein